jgi:hypothetical protein
MPGSPRQSTRTNWTDDATKSKEKERLICLRAGEWYRPLAEPVSTGRLG